MILAYFEFQIKVELQRSLQLRHCPDTTYREIRFSWASKCRASTPLWFKAVGWSPISPSNSLKFTWYDRDS